VEINTHGYRKKKIDTPCGQRYSYPLEPFWELAAGYDLPVIISSDAHNPEDLGARVDEASRLAHRYGLRLTDLPHLEYSDSTGPVLIQPQRPVVLADDKTRGDERNGS
jgi:hypothetical protein